MQRTAINELKKWLNDPGRKPLVIRGARQVGKTWLIRHIADLSQKRLIELNLEKFPEHVSLFSTNDPKQVLINLSAIYGQTIDPLQSLLFLDEIQAAPQLLSKLRWFAEDLPQLPVIAAGSLLEFVLADHSFSMPVGRISYMHIEPLSFEEFLLAQDKQILLNYLQAYDLTQDIPSAIHGQLMQLFKEYIYVGGLPGVVTDWVATHDLNKVHQIQYDLLATYRDDFAKYKGRLAIERLDKVMMAVPRMLGKKFVSSHVDESLSTSIVKKILDLLDKARLCHPVWSTAANGIPLAAEIKTKHFKEIFLDIGLCCAALGLNLTQINAEEEIILINQGALSEQVVGQLLRTIEPSYVEPALYYWQREEKGSSAEVDYVISHGNQVIPIEVKAGSTGGLKSLHLFMGLKRLSVAARINSNTPSKTPVNHKDHYGKNVTYTLLSIPFYLTGQIHRLLNTL